MTPAATTQPKDFDLARLAKPGSTEQGLATVYITQGVSDAGMRVARARSIQVFSDDQPRGELRARTSAHSSLAPGRHVLLMKWPPFTSVPDIAVEGDFEADKTYYFVYTAYMVANSPHFTITSTFGPATEAEFYRAWSGNEPQPGSVAHPVSDAPTATTSPPAESIPP
jgi:hypothetical protein